MLSQLCTKRFLSAFPVKKLSLAPLPFAYGSLEPFISADLNKYHHDMHHQAYVDKYNAASDQLSKETDFLKRLALFENLNFLGGAYRNHNLLWNSLCAADVHLQHKTPTGALQEAIERQYKDVATLQNKITGELTALQGSGWVFLVKRDGVLSVEVKNNQDTIYGGTVLLALDAWEHSYYLQYQNRKADFFKATWNVVNWEYAEDQFSK